MNRLLILLLAIFVFACNDAGKGHPLIGEWNNLSIRVEVNSKRNSNDNQVFEVDRANWEKELKIKPIATVFRKDNTWTSSYYDLQGTLMNKSSGKWWIKGSKLTMFQLVPSPDTAVYTFHINKDTVSFEGMLDWDSDGKKDDKYFGKQVKVIR